MLAPLLVTSVFDGASDLRLTARDPELAAYVRTELLGDASRIAVPTARAALRPGVRTRLRYWLNSFRGFAILDVRGGRA